MSQERTQQREWGWSEGRLGQICLSSATGVKTLVFVGLSGKFLAPPKNFLPFCHYQTTLTPIFSIYFPSTPFHFQPNIP